MAPQSNFISRAESQSELEQSANSLQTREFHRNTARLREALTRDEKPNIPSASDHFPEGARVERRKARRRPAGTPVHLHLQDGRVGETFVLELSELGCRLFQTGPVLERFSKLGLWFGEIGPIQGRVCWSVGGVSGIEFSTPINPVIVNRFTKP